MRSSLLVLALFLCGHFASAQLPVIKGRSEAHAGMLYYDSDRAQDRKERSYLYTISPDSAACLQLDFTLVSDPGDGNFIRLYAGKDPSAPLLEQLGSGSGSRLLQFPGKVLTVEFLRVGEALASTWTLSWRSDRQGGCILPGTQRDSCPDVQDICGPSFSENFHYFGPRPGGSTAIEGACIDGPHHSSWYRFMAVRDGDLQFKITPHNGRDDYDWVLWQVRGDSAPDCPSRLSVDQQSACNHAAGRGISGSTGMALSGNSLRASSTDNPFSRTIAARKGDVFFLLVDDYSQHSQGFQLDFNDVVLACENPRRDFLPLAHKPPLAGKPIVPAQNQFSRYTRILRIDLGEKSNQALQQCSLPWAAVADLPGSKPLDADGRLVGPGIGGALLTGLKYGCYPAYAAHDHASPVHFGDILVVAGAEGDWEDSDGKLEGFNEVLELIVDEVFDRTSGRKRQQIRMVRLVWRDSNPGLPERNVALIQFEDVVSLLDRLELPNPHNEASSMTALDFLNGQMYNAINISQRSKPNRSLEEASFERSKEIEYEDYRWDY